MAARESSPRMSGKRESPSPERRFPPYRGKIVTDSVNSRMKRPKLFCETCKVDIIGGSTEIEKHFSPMHKHNSLCPDCAGKVFNYIEINHTHDGVPTLKEHAYHMCLKQ
ncbi:uncharacterized protein [Fopius arisanus]|uniref:Uncharacterized protein n=1 Tax=Fopius arisanus TaxID=64838 RepID=A0A9R1TDY9_9HYME|nr:PREDICTED: uncharacterized protein LOC105269028 [Fopius arisanus]